MDQCSPSFLIQVEKLASKCNSYHDDTLDRGLWLTIVIKHGYSRLLRPYLMMVQYLSLIYSKYSVVTGLKFWLLASWKKKRMKPLD